MKIMSPVSYRSREYLWVVAPLDLEVFCEKLRVALQLPAFHFDAENVWEWGLTRIEDGFVEINVSRKHRHGAPLFEEPIRVLLLLDKSAPAPYGKDWLMGNLIEIYGTKIANLTEQPTHYGVVEYVDGQDFIYRPLRTFQSQT